MTASAAWFAMRPGAQHQGKVIKLPLMYIGTRILTSAEMAGSGEHIVGISTQGGGHFDWVDSLGDLASGDEFWITILTDGTPIVTVKLELLANGRNFPPTEGREFRASPRRTGSVICAAAGFLWVRPALPALRGVRPWSWILAFRWGDAPLAGLVALGVPPGITVAVEHPSGSYVTGGAQDGRVDHRQTHS